MARAQSASVLADGSALRRPHLSRRRRRGHRRPRSGHRTRAHSAGAARRLRFPFLARQIWDIPAMAARDPQRGPTAGCASRRVFLYCPLHDRYRCGCGMAMGRYLSRSPRLHESCPAAHLDPDHLPGQSRGSAFLSRIDRIRCQRCLVHPLPHGSGSDAEQIPILCEIRGWCMRSE